MYLYLMAAVPRATDKYAKAALPKTPMKVEWSRGTKNYKMAVHMLSVVYGCYLPFTRHKFTYTSLKPCRCGVWVLS